MKSAASLDSETVVKLLGSNPDGLYNEEVTTSRIQYGRNEVTNHNRHHVLKRLSASSTKATEIPSRFQTARIRICP